MPLLKRRELVLGLIILGLVIVIAIRAPVFITPESLLNIITDTSFLFMLALAQMTVILTRGIDLSVAANLAMAGMLTALASRAMPEMPIVLIIGLSTLCGLALGAVAEDQQRRIDTEVAAEQSPKDAPRGRETPPVALEVELGGSHALVGGQPRGGRRERQVVQADGEDLHLAGGEAWPRGRGCPAERGPHAVTPAEAAVQGARSSRRHRQTASRALSMKK